MDYPMGTPTARTLEDWKQQCEDLRAELAAARKERDHYKRALKWLGEQGGSQRYFFVFGETETQYPHCPLQPKIALEDRTSCPYAPEGFDQPCQVREGNMTLMECCEQAALAATKEDE